MMRKDMQLRWTRRMAAVAFGAVLLPASCSSQPAVSSRAHSATAPSTAAATPATITPTSTAASASLPTATATPAVTSIPSPTSKPAPAIIKVVEPSEANYLSWTYAPDKLTLHVGDTVVWTNTGKATHTVTADNGAFDSGSLRPGQSWRFTFTKVGTYAYHCIFHPWMKSIIVIAR